MVRRSTAQNNVMTEVKVNGHSQEEKEIKKGKGVKRKADQEQENVEQPKLQVKAKRGRPTGAASKAKKAKLALEISHPKYQGDAGVVLCLGQGDTGQLGLGEDILERSKPALVKDLEGVVDICAGGMHSVCLTRNGEVFTFGCNDEGSLGRTTEDDEECFTPKKVQIPGKVVQISAGDSHTVALNDQGKVYYWGTFRDSSGSFGLTPNGIEKLPVPLAHHLNVVRVASGSDHVALLTADGELFTVGCAEQGQLGRVGERFVARGGRRGVGVLLNPEQVHAKNRRVTFADVWAGSYSTYALTSDGDVLVCGLNNYNQLGIDKGQMFYTLQKSNSFTKVSKECGWQQIVPGQHHALALDKSGRVYAIGRNEYGRLGLGEGEKEDAKVPTRINEVKENIVDVSCGTAVSFAVSDKGSVLSWGMGTNGQLGHEDEEDSWTPQNMIGKQLETRNVLAVSGGGQHTMLLAEAKK